MAMRCSKCRHRDASVVVGSDDAGRYRVVTCRACGHQATQRAHLTVNVLDSAAGRWPKHWCWPDGAREPA